MSGRKGRWKNVGMAAGVAVAILAAGCGESAEERIKAALVPAQATVADLGTALDEGGLRNAMLVQQYAKAVATQRPDIAEIAEGLGREGTRGGRAYAWLGKRLDRVPAEPQGEAALIEALTEIERVRTAAAPDTFDAGLVDVLNVLAELSEGKLAKIDVPQGEEGGAQGAAGRLVGNPAYGEWREDPNTGGLTWFFAGWLAGSWGNSWRGHGWGYDDWYRDRRWTYHSDVGRERYGTSRETRRWAEAQRRNPGVASTRRSSIGGSPAASGGSARSTRSQQSTFAKQTTRETRPGSKGTAGTTNTRSSKSTWAASTRTGGGSRRRGK